MTEGLSNRKIFGWLRVLAGFGSAQILIQALGFLSGILIVQFLPKADYAWFTITNTLIATMSMLADVGVSGALSSIGGRVWQDNVRFGSLIRTALTLRRTLAWGSVAVVTPFLVWMLMKNSAPVGIIAVLLPAALIGFSFQLTASVLGVVISLRQEIARMQGIALAVACLRVALIGIAALVFIDARIAVMAGVLATGLQVWLVRRWTLGAVDVTAPESPEYRTEILSVVKRQAPLTIFFCIQSQIGVWLISFFGNEQRVADIGALGRFALIFTLVSSVMSGVVVPRFARCQYPGVLRRRYWQVAIGFALIAGVLVGASAVFPRPLLWVLGAKYANLENEVWLMMLSAAVGGLFTTLFSLTYSKGWIAPAAISIPLEIAVQAILMLLLDISTVRGVLWIGCITPIPMMLMNMIVAHAAMRRIPSPADAGASET